MTGIVTTRRSAFLPPTSAAWENRVAALTANKAARATAAKRSPGPTITSQGVTA